ncbi:MlaD family protein [Nocardia huaxiensis]|uniref:MCE family protein n=1 Tax=Nocardia huaxiensis TaxID=2755382 RepID=A0A7D6VI19_9NOCA|nr:MlaD family protein [Nocardia huaxiensis]QLY30456.1 MCE family protein [Nocardia huaxiensis]UFS95945.1 MlaD family protein [Nocardia huaxiensis]
MKLGSLLSLGSIAAISILGSAYLTVGVVRTDGFTEYTNATMLLTDSAGLGAGSRVLLTGVEVGEITSVRNTAGGVEVALRFDSEFEVPADSLVTIENLSALGEPYVEFTPNTDGGPYLRDGQRIDTAAVTPPMSISEVSRLVNQVLTQLDPEAISGFVDTFGTALHGTDAVIPGLARSTDLLAATLASRDPKIGAMLTDLQSIVPDMNWSGPAMAAGAPAFIEFGQRVDEIAQAIGRLVATGDTPAMYMEGNGLIPFLAKLTAWIDTAGPGLQELAPVLQPLVESATASAPRIDLSALISQALNGIGDDGAVRLRITVK